jgi:hypothetical protein
MPSFSTENLEPRNTLEALLQIRVAFGSIAGSTVRNMGPKGTMRAAQDFLSRPIVLEAFQGIEDSERFMKVLDEQTEALRICLPLGKNKNGSLRGQHWGCARKCFNIFLYECVLNRFLCSRFRIMNIEPFLEVPLDSLVIAGLTKDAKTCGLSVPDFEAVIKLTPFDSAVFQKAAQEIAKEKYSTQRVNLDLHYWKQGQSETI